LGQAARISGVNPSAIQALLIYLKAHKVSKPKRKSREYLKSAVNTVETSFSDSALVP
jgi:hypothetical protein